MHIHIAFVVPTFCSSLGQDFQWYSYMQTGHSSFQFMEELIESFCSEDYNHYFLSGQLAYIDLDSCQKPGSLVSILFSKL